MIGPRLNSLDPRAKRFRAADRSLQQARNALQGALLVLQDIPRPGTSPLTTALDAIGQAVSNLDEATALLDEARMDSGGDD